MTDSKDIRILCLIDSPTLTTGFSTVGQNVLPHWLAQGAKIDVWGIGFNGHGYQSWPGLRILPAGVIGDWRSRASLEDFLQTLAQLDANGQPVYTHCFILQDLFHFKKTFCDTFQHVCTQRGIRSLMYFPVDAVLEPEWTRILSVVDVAVAYTEFGKREVEAAAARGQMRLNCHVLPHGVDQELFQPRPETREADRRMWQVGPDNKPAVFCRPDDFLMLNVNTNQWRKDGARSLEILAELLARKVPAKLIMHCRKATHYGTDLEAVGRQLGLQLYRDWIHSGDLFGETDLTFMGYDKLGRAMVGSMVSKEDLARMYNAADLVISTSLGEGWGLSITEALATGTPVAIPNHTSCREIALSLEGLDDGAPPNYNSRQVIMLPANDKIVMPAEMSRVRQRVQMPHAADAVQEFYRSGNWHARLPLGDRMKDWLSWPRIAKEMFKLLVGDGIRASTAKASSKTQVKTQSIEIPA